MTTTAPAQVNTDQKFVKTEMYDPNMMDALLCDTASFSTRDLRNLSRYKKEKGKQHGNKRDVVYSYGRGCAEYELGRLYATGGLGIQSFPRDIRNPLIQKHYWDCDMENAHYNILATLGRKWGVITTHIQQYIDNRNVELSRVSSVRGVAKTAFLKVAYGGNIKLYDETINDDGIEPDGDVSLLKKIEVEMETIVDLCWSKHVKFHKLVKNKTSPRFSLFALILQTEERKCLLAMDEYLKTQGRSMDIFIHDGGEVRKLPDETEFPDALLTGMEDAVRSAVGYDMRIITKPIEHSFRLPDQGVLDPDIVVDDAFAADVFAKLMGDRIILDSGRVWVFDEGLWSFDETHIQRVITSMRGKLVFKQLGPMGVRVSNYSGSVKNTHNLMVKLPDVLPRRDGYFKERIHTDIGKLLFPNGIYDFKTKTFSPEFDPNIIFTGRMPRPFPALNKSVVDEIRRISFDEAFNNDIARKTLLHSLMRAYIGDTLRKKFNIGTGWGNSGKGMLATLLHTSMGMLCTDFNGNSLLYKGGSGESSREYGWLMANVRSRIAIGSEVKVKDDDKNICIDGVLIKTISSGVDEIKMRGLYEKDTGFVNKATFFMFAQDIPAITPAEKTTVDRLVAFEWSYSYVENPVLAYEKMKDPELANKYSTAEYGDAMFWLMVEEYEAWREGGFVEPPLDEVVAQDRERFADMVDYKQTLLDNGIEFGTPDDYVDFKIIAPLFRCSKTMLGRNLAALGLTKKVKKDGGKSITAYFGVKLSGSE